MAGFNGGSQAWKQFLTWETASKKKKMQTLLKLVEDKKLKLLQS